MACYARCDVDAEYALQALVLSHLFRVRKGYTEADDIPISSSVESCFMRPIFLNRRSAPANFGTNKCRLFCDWAAWSGPSGDTANAITHRHSERPASSGRA